MPIHQALIASGGFLLYMELAYPWLPFWAKVTYTIGFMTLVNGMAGAIDLLGELGMQAIKKLD